MPTSFTWDNNGNMLAKGAQTFTWDQANRLTGLTNGGATASYTYNGDGVRVGRTVNGITTAYLQDLAAGFSVVLRETTSGSHTNYVYGNDLKASINNDGVLSFYHTDGLGSTRLLTNNSGVVTDRYSYDVFGSSRTHTGVSAQPFTYTGEQVDPEAGLVYLRARYYEPATGRFNNVDPFMADATESQSLNRFVYVRNNPIRFTDPEGLSTYEFSYLNEIFLNINRNRELLKNGQR